MDVAEQDIQKGKYNLVSQVLYGGLASGALVLPTNFIKIILSLIFPPLGTIFEIIEDKLLNKFPYITWNTLKKLLVFENINKIIYTFILTSMFYIPGLIHALAHIRTVHDGGGGTLQCDSDTGNCVELSSLEEPTL